MKKLELKAYAKINTALDVLGTKPGGYHEISTVMQQIGLYDKVGVRWMPGTGAGILIEINSNKKYLPTGKKNIVYKASELMTGTYDIKGRFGAGKVRIDIKKQIPVSAGLGGGSTDCAAVLCALSDIWELRLSIDELCALGAKLGSDVPFCVLGQFGVRCALAGGTGTEITPASGIKCHIVLSRPPVRVSTADVYAGFDSLDPDSLKRPDITALLAAIKESDLKAAKKNMINVLENYTASVYPGVMETKERMLRAPGAFKVLMSGSGPTIVGFYEDKESAEAAYREMADFNKETYLTTTLV